MDAAEAVLEISELGETRSWPSMQIYWVVATQTFFIFAPILGKIPVLTHIFQMGWFNHQLVNGWRFQLDDNQKPWKNGLEITMEKSILKWLEMEFVWLPKKQGGERSV